MLRTARLACAFLLSLCAVAWGQGAILQGGPWTAGHIPQYVGQGSSQPVVQDGGGAGGGALGNNPAEIGIVARGTGAAPFIGQGTGPFGTINCTYDGPVTGPNHYLCLSAYAGSGGLIAFGAEGGATPTSLIFDINGTNYTFPFTSGGILGPGTTVVGHVALWNNTVGTLLSDAGLGITAGTTGQLGYWSSGTNLGGLTIGTGLAVGGSQLNLQPAQPAVIGGIESITCAAHMWLFTVSTAGVPSCSQPAFADIQGTLASAQCPNGTSAATGCLEGDGSTLTITGGVVKCTTATTSQLGCVKPDGTSITISGAGVISTNNGAIVAPQAGRFLPILSAGGCSASSPFTCMQFCVYNGNQYLVNGVFQTIPAGQCVSSGGVVSAYNNACIENASFVTTCAQTLSANTLYYAYLGMVSNVLTIVWSTNCHAPSLCSGSSPYGNEVMGGDVTRSLIGMCQTNGSGQFVGSASQQNCTSWPNKVYDGLQVAITGNFSTGSYADINAADHLTYTEFSDNIPTLYSNCVVQLASGGPINPTIGIGVSATGTAATLPANQSQITADSSTTLRQVAIQQSGAIGSEGYIIANLLGLSQSSTQVNVSSCTLGLPSREPS